MSKWVALIGKALAFTLMLAIPVLGTWCASSLAAYWNGSTAIAITAGALAFPVLPLLWEGWSERRRRVAQRASDAPPKKRILTFTDRLILRTLLLDGALLAILFYSAPQAIFTALSTRGDWFLEGAEWAGGARRVVLSVADRMEWLYKLAYDNPYASEADEQPDPGPTPTAGSAIAQGGEGTTSDAGAPVRDLGPEAIAADAGAHADGGVARVEATPVEAPTPDVPTPTAPRARTWPFEQVVHPAVASIAASDERSIDSVATYLRAQADDPVDRAKAVHDYVATRVAYDVPALHGRRPRQDVQTVFSTHAAVCEGYARLFVALGRSAGLEARYLVGDARDADDPTGAEPHAWSAVRLDGGWYLVDATWDAGSVEGDTFTPRYSSMYFLTPPAVFGADHFPDDVVWQLRPDPLSRGEFQRRPVLGAGFVASGFHLESPDRAQIDVDASSLDLRLTSDDRSFLLVSVLRHGARGEAARCDSDGAGNLKVFCPIPSTGIFDVVFFAGAEQYGTHSSVGGIQVTRR